MSIEDVPVFILAGGLGTRFREQTHLLPKPMIEVGGKPILWHIMDTYAGFGFRRFVVCAGYKAEVIKDYFLNYQKIHSDFTVDMRRRTVTFHSNGVEDWSVTVADTGATTMTGYRVHDATDRFLADCDTFALTYGDGLTDANLGAELAFHRAHGKIGTVLGIHPPSRFGELKAKHDAVTTFAEKRPLANSWISGGFFFLDRRFTSYLSSDPDLVLEESPMRSLVADHELMMYRHEGFWACMDTQRDRDQLDALANGPNPPWRPELQIESDRPLRITVGAH
ncbi:sugar phosphate nucleotidyltransferase [Agromyces sp. NPDC058126]|uniref:sugar phosphate nucleotidyltransferase n=1 Tax=Agromyces sp. NPDC058126 TaxID=3346350 RepID=UPI0036DCFBBE